MIGSTNFDGAGLFSADNWTGKLVHSLELLWLTVDVDGVDLELEGGLQESVSFVGAVSKELN